MDNNIEYFSCHRQRMHLTQKYIKEFFQKKECKTFNNYEECKNYHYDQLQYFNDCDYAIIKTNGEYFKIVRNG